METVGGGRTAAVRLTSVRGVSWGPRRPPGDGGRPVGRRQSVGAEARGGGVPGPVPAASLLAHPAVFLALSTCRDVHTPCLPSSLPRGGVPVSLPAASLAASTGPGDTGGQRDLTPVPGAVSTVLRCQRPDAALVSSRTPTPARSTAPCSSVFVSEPATAGKS